MKRRILLIDDDLAVLLTLKAVLELHEFEVDTAGGTAEAFTRMESGVYHMVISDLRMETEEAGLEVIRAAHRQSYAPATALLTAFPLEDDDWGGKSWCGEPRTDADRIDTRPDTLLVKPIGTTDLVRQIEALLIRHADQQQIRQRTSDARTQVRGKSAG